MKLSAEQLKAVHAPLHKPVAILAGPGSGKTTVLTHRLVWMVDEKHIPPNKILAVTFTSDMAKEIMLRADKMGADIPERNISTIHAFCYRALRAWGDTRQKSRNWTVRDAIQKTIDRIGWDVPVKAVDWWIDRSKQDGVQQSSGPLIEYFADMGKRTGFPAYSAVSLAECALAVGQRLHDDNTLTYADMVNDLWWKIHGPGSKQNLEWLSARYQYILVDEGQDTFELAVRILRTIAPKNFYIVGDTDQLLFRYAGASPEANLYAVADDGVAFKLSENRRSVPAIVEASRLLISNNYTNGTRKFQKDLTAFNPPSGTNEPPIVIHAAANAREEADWIAETILQEELPPSQVFVGTRTNAQLGIIERAMIKHDIPYVVTGNAGFFQRKHIQAVTAYMRLSLDENDDESFEKIYNISTKDFRDLRGQHIGHRYLGAQFLSEVSKPPSRLKTIRTGAYSNRFRRGVLDILAFVDRLHRLIYDSSQATADVLQVIVADCYLPHYQVENGIQSIDPSSDDDIYDDLMVLLEMAQDYPSPAAFLKFVDKMVAYESNRSSERVVELSTIHRLKGRERRCVFAAGWAEGLLPHARVLYGQTMIDSERESLLMLNESSVSDERCLAYVVVTRAKSRIFVSWPEIWNDNEMLPSRFIAELQGEVETSKR